jgi:hypothetical protein
MRSLSGASARLLQIRTTILLLLQLYLPTPAFSSAAFTARALTATTLLAASSPVLSVYPPILILALDRLLE